MSELAANKETPGVEAKSGKRWFAAAGALGALLASSCCILPLILISLGVSGAWIGSLTALEAYKPVFIGIAAVFIAAGFWRVYFRKSEPCEEGTICARPDSARLTKTALWISAILVLLAATIDYWAPLFY